MRECRRIQELKAERQALRESGLQRRQPLGHPFTVKHQPKQIASTEGTMITLKTISLAYLVCLFITCISSTPVPDDRTDASAGTTASTTVDSCLEWRIKNVTLKLDSLNKQVIESLAEQVVRDATEIPVNVNNDSADKSSATVELTYRESGEETTEATVIKQQQSSTSSPSSTSTSVVSASVTPAPVAPASESQEQDKKFSSVLREIKDLEETIQVAIRNFTSTRQFAYGAMLRPMLSNIQQLRTNLTMLRNRMIGFVALTEIRTQVNHLTDEIGDAIVAVTEKPVLFNHIADVDADSTPVSEDAVKPLQDSLSWVTE